MHNLSSPLAGIRSPFGRRRMGLAFSPASLFAASEPGAWLDPSDLSTLYQDAAGTTPVTAAGQSVGLVLDKSQGLVLGPERVTNGTFDTNVSGWTEALGDGASISWSAGSMLLTCGTKSVRAYQVFPTVVGRSYRFQASATALTASTSGYRITTDATGGPIGQISVETSIAGNWTRDFIFVATGSSVTVAILSGAPSGSTLTADNISVRELPGNHVTQATAAARPTYQVDSNGRGYLSFDGVDDFLVTPTITPGLNKAQVFAGVRKLSDAALGMVAELGTNVSSVDGSLGLQAPGTAATANMRFSSRGTSLVSPPSPATFPAPVTVVLAGLGDISGDNATLRVNGTQAAQSTADQGTGNYLAYPLYIGRRGGTSLPFNGRIYGLIVRFGANLTADQITQTEAWMNSKTGAY